MARRARAAISIFLVLVMMCYVGVPAFAAENDEVFAITSSYNPFANTNGRGDNRSIIGDDDRAIVSTTNTFPYSAIAYLTILYLCGCENSGTGFMVSKNCMLTAGHCIICSFHGYQATSITAQFGYKSSSSYLLSTTATSSNAIFYHDPLFTGVEKDYDYGYVVFNTNVGNTTGWLGLSVSTNTSLNGMNINATGYSNGIMYKGAGTITSVEAKRIKYNADTIVGESGAPVYYQHATYGNVAVAIHTNGANSTESNNSGWRITSDFFNTLANLGYITKATVGGGGRSTMYN